MELKKFIATTINEICDGISLAKEHQIKTRNNCAIAPGTFEGEKVMKMEHIDFELLVEVEEGSKKNGEGKINVLATNVGGKIEKLENVKNVNKISFSVPYFPQTLRKKNK